MNKLEIGNLVKVVDFYCKDSFANRTFRVGDICVVVNIGKKDKDRDCIFCGDMAKEFCKKSDEKQCVFIKNERNNSLAWICDVQVELI